MAADRILINGLAARCLIGVNDHERVDKQDVIIDIELSADVREAGRTDDVADTVDYKAIKKRALSIAEASSFKLVESLAERIAAMCLEDLRVEAVKVKVEKPGALRFARSAAVEIARSRRDA